MQHRFVSLPLIRTALVAAAAVWTSAALAGPINYASHSVGIRAGVVVTDSNRLLGVAMNSTPFVWYNLDHNALVKPAGWNFYNPHAPSNVTQAMFNRWSQISSATAGTPPLAAGSPLTKATAGYWEVPLSTATDSSINDYDVLSLSVYNTNGVSGLLSLNPAERSRLARFVDHGGVLWIDVQSGMKIDDANAAPISFSLVGSTGQATTVNPASQIFSYPFTIGSLPEATYAGSLSAVNLGGDGYGALTAILASVPLEFSQYEVCGTDGPGGNPTVITSRIGNGAIIVTCRGTAKYLNQSSFNGVPIANDGFIAVDSPADANANQAARFAINAVNLLNDSPQDGQGSRRSSGSPVDITAPLIKTWFDETRGGGPAPTATPVVYKGLMVVSQPDDANPGQWCLYAYSATPGSDLDFNGNPDDGLPDFSLGKPRDLIWKSVPMQGPLSAAAAFEVPNPGGGRPTDMVAVMDHAGNLQLFNAFPLVGGSFITVPNPSYATLAPPNGNAFAWAAGQAPFGPTVHEGLIYVTDNVDNGLGSPTGRVWVVDARTGTYANSNPGNAAANAWAIGGAPNSPLQQASASVTIGYIPIADNSGGVDRVVYLPTAPQAVGAGGQTCGITSIWAGTKGEHHALQYDNNLTPTKIVVSPRALAAGKPVFLPGFTGFAVPAPDLHGVHVTLLDANGDALPAATVANVLTGNCDQNGSDLEFTLVSASAASTNGVVAVAIDYSLDWNYSSGANQNLIRGSVFLPDDSNRTKQIIGNLALSPAGTLYAVEADPNDAQADGIFFALREQGQGGFNVVTRFDLYDKFTLSTPGVTAVQNTTIPTTFEDNDQTQSIPAASPYISGPFTDLVFESGPAVANGRVFVKARGKKKSIYGFQVPCTLLLCFNAEPTLPSFQVPVLSPSFTIFQPDYNRSTDKTQPETFTQVAASQVTYIQGVDHASISMDSLSTSTKAQLSQTLSESLPIIIRQPGSPDITIDPSTVGSWSPLQWYSVFYGIDPGETPGFGGAVAWQTGPPVVTGNTVFLDGNSYLPYIFAGQNFLGANPTGMIVGYNAALSGTSDAYAVPNKARPYFNQISQVAYNLGTGSFSANPDQLWPQNSSAKSFTEYRQRLYQTVLDGANLTNPPIVYGLAAGQNSLFAYSNLGVYGFKRANFVVADEARLASFDPSGNALWTSDTSASYGVGVISAAGQENPAITHPLVRPTRAYPLGNDFLVVDPGSNRLARLDASGREVRSIESFLVDPIFQPDGYIAGEPLVFNQPQDVLTYADYQTGGSSPFSGAQATEYWRHYVIADTGNHRLIEIVDRYAVNPATNQPTQPIALGVLFWHSPSNVSGKKGYDFNSVARVLVPGSGQNGTPEKYIYATSIGSTQPSGVGLGLDKPVQDQVPTSSNYTFQARDARNGNGGIMVFNGGSSQVINQVVVPQIGANVLYDPTTGTFNAAPIPAHYKTLGGLSSVTMSYVQSDVANAPSVLTIMFTDSTGVYEISQAPNPIVGGNLPTTEWVVDWMLPTEVYKQLRRDPGTGLPNQAQFLNASELKATYARRTSAGTVLLVNSYFGTNQDPAQTAFPGEIIEVDGSMYSAATNGLTGVGFSFAQPFLGFGSLSVVFQLPSVQGARGIVAPIFADRR